MLRRKGEVYQAFLRIVHNPQRSPQGYHSSSVATVPPRHSAKPPTSLSREGCNRSVTTATRIQSSPSPRQQQQYELRYGPSPRTHNTHAIKHHHHATKSLSSRRSSSTFDPELAACMERWIRIVFSGQRRMQSTLAKPLPNLASASAYSVADISDQAISSVTERAVSQNQLHTPPLHRHEQQHIQEQLKPSTTTRPNHLRSDIPKRIREFRRAMDDLPIEDHELPSAFRPLGGIKGKRKTMFSQTRRRTVEALWSHYEVLCVHMNRRESIPTPLPTTTTITTTTSSSSSLSASIPTSAISRLTSKSEQEDARLSRRDYTRLLRILRYSFDSTQAAARILTVHRDLCKQDIRPTARMYEIVVQAHILLNAFPESVEIYREATAMLRPGTLQHKQLLWTMVDTFAANRMGPQGIAFLDQLPAMGDVSWFENEPGQERKLFVHGLYRRIYHHYLKSDTTSSAAPQCLALIKNFTELSRPPRVKDLLRTLHLFETDTSLQGTDALQLFSKTVAGMLVKMGNAQAVIPLVRSLLLSCHVQEAARVLDMMLKDDLEPETDRIRLSLLQSFDSCPDKDDLKSVIEQWDAVVAKCTGVMYQAQQWQSDHASNANPGAAEYSNLVRKYVMDNDLTGALSAAKYMSLQGWSPQGIVSQELSSAVINKSVNINNGHRHRLPLSDHTPASDYPVYLEIRYTLGGALTPDLHTYRRLVYAACRRSDLFSALTLFRLARTRHPSWKLDSTIYNAIIATASATGEMSVAEKTFTCLLQDGLSPDHYSFHGLLHGYGQAGDLEAAVMIPEQMIKHNLQPTTKTFNLVMKAYIAGRGRGDLATSRKLLKAMHLSSGKDGARKGAQDEDGVLPDLVTFNQLLEGYRRVGNHVWFDAYFDRYFGNKQNHSNASQESQLHKGDPGSIRTEDAGKTSKSRIKSKRATASIVRPEKSDDRTLLIQLKHSLRLPNVDLPTLQELWRAIEPKLRPASSPTFLPSDTPHAYTTELLTAESSSDAENDPLPLTHMPFRRWLDPIWMPATDLEHFRFTTLMLFRSAFRSRGDIVSVKKIDGIIAELFPQHPQGQAVLNRRMVKKLRTEVKKYPKKVRNAKAK